MKYVNFTSTGSQKTNDLKDALDAETDKTQLMQDAMKKVDIEMKRSDELLSQMIPKAVAEKVKKGLSPVDTCEVFYEPIKLLNIATIKSEFKLYLNCLNRFLNK